MVTLKGDLTLKQVAEIFRQVRRDSLPLLVRDLLGDGREGFRKGRAGGSGPQHRYRTRIVLDDNFVASAHVIQQRGKVACRFRSRDMYHTASHVLIIP